MVAKLIKAGELEESAGVDGRVKRLQLTKQGQRTVAALTMTVGSASSMRWGQLLAMAWRMGMAIKDKPLFLPFTVLTVAAIAGLRWPMPVVRRAPAVRSGSRRPRAS